MQIVVSFYLKHCVYTYTLYRLCMPVRTYVCTYVFPFWRSDTPAFTRPTYFQHRMCVFAQCGLASILSSSHVHPSVQDYTTLKREYRVHFVKVPTGDVVNEMVSAWSEGRRDDMKEGGKERAKSSGRGRDKLRIMYILLPAVSTGES